MQSQHVLVQYRVPTVNSPAATRRAECWDREVELDDDDDDVDDDDDDDPDDDDDDDDDDDPNDPEEVPDNDDTEESRVPTGTAAGST